MLIFISTAMTKYHHVKEKHFKFNFSSVRLKKGIKKNSLNSILAQLDLKKESS